MNTEAAFLADIAEHPDDDAPRLVFADWLEDQGRGPQGEFIRVQCDLERLGPSDERVPVLRAREYYLVKRYGAGWAGGWLGLHLPHLGGSRPYHFRRGMMEGLSLQLPTLRQHGEDLFARLPIRHLDIFGVAELGDLADAPYLKRLTGLGLRGNLEPHRASLSRLCKRNALANLRSLSLECYLLSHDTWRTLAGSLAPGGLEQLRLTRTYGLGFYSRPATLAAMLADPATSALRRLELDSQSLGDTLLADLCAMPGEPLRELTMVSARIEATLRPEDQRRGLLPSLLRALRRPAPPVAPSDGLARLLGGLNRLSLRNVGVTGSLGLGGLLGLGQLESLHTLELDHMSRSAVSLTGSHLASLATLGLPNMEIQDAGLAVLVSGPAVARLTTLDLASNRLTAAAVPLLTDTPALSRLRWLSLRGNPLREGLRRLIDSALVERLAWLDLRNTGLSEADALRLADSAPRLKALSWLDLRKNGLTNAVKSRLSKAFWPAAQIQA